MDAYYGEIRAFPFTFVPPGWVLCDGRLLNIQSNQVLFALLGTVYGGNGQSTFGVPNLLGRAIVGTGQGTGLTFRALNTPFGAASVTLTSGTFPPHQHTMSVVHPTTDLQNQVQNAPTANTSYLARAMQPTSATTFNSIFAYTKDTQQSLDAAMHTWTIGGAGTSGPHENRQPFQAMYYCICAQNAVFPTPD